MDWEADLDQQDIRWPDNFLTKDGYDYSRKGKKMIQIIEKHSLGYAKRNMKSGLLIFKVVLGRLNQNIRKNSAGIIYDRK